MEKYIFELKKDYKMDYTAILENRLKEADSGRIFYNQFIEKFSIKDKDIIIALLDRDRETAEIVLNYGQYLKSTDSSKNIYVLTDSEELMEKSKTKNWVSKTSLCRTGQMEQLVLLYQVYKFSRQLIFGTLYGIEDADGTCLKGIKGLSLEEIIVTAVLDLPFDKCKR